MMVQEMPCGFLYKLPLHACFVISGNQTPQLAAGKPGKFHYRRCIIHGVKLSYHVIPVCPSSHNS